MQPLQLGAHVVAQLGVEIGQRLVQQQDLRPADQRTAERDALLLAARQCRRLLLEADASAAAFRRSRRTRLSISARRNARLRPRDRRDSVEDRQMRIEREGLKHHRDAAALDGRVRHVGAADLDGPAIGLHQAGDGAQRCRLADRTRAEQDEKPPSSTSKLRSDNARTAP